MRLIDAETFEGKLDNWDKQLDPSVYADRIIRDVLTSVCEIGQDCEIDDVVPVVRCEDCKLCDKQFMGDPDLVYCHNYEHIKRANSYCSDGECEVSK